MRKAETSAVAEILRRRNVRSIAYFHCDHFEPWRNVHGTVSEANAAHIVHFAEATAKLDHARRLTLFYRAHVSPTMQARDGAVFAPDTPLGFVRPSEDSVRTARAGMGNIAAATEHEIQVHIHHEYITRNEKYCFLSKWGEDFFRNVDTPAMDRRRLDLLTRLSLETIRRESGLALTSWLFIHGNWGLNGSDRNVCTIDDEILLLQEHGCVGDFTFPAKEPHDCANPAFDQPVTIKPFAAPKCYDRPEADAQPAFDTDAGARALDPNRFFIWAAPLSCPASLDYHQEPVRARCEDPPCWARAVALNAPVLGGTLYFQTYAHSMNLKYTVDGATVFPHEFSPVRDMFACLFDGAAAAGAAVDFLTAREVRDGITRNKGAEVSGCSG